MQRQSKNAVVRRLEFAVAELEAISEIASLEGDTVIVDQLDSLTDRIRGCIRSVLNGQQSDSFQPSACCPFVGTRT